MVAMHSFTVSAVFPVAPEVIYLAWLNPHAHGEMTGSEAEGTGDVGEMFTAWGGYIVATTLELTPRSRIVQAWRTSEFAPTDPDSRIEVRFEAAEGGTRVTITHSEITSGADNYRQGWEDYYFAPMRAYFGTA